MLALSNLQLQFNVRFLGLPAGRDRVFRWVCLGYPELIIGTLLPATFCRPVNFGTRC